MLDLEPTPGKLDTRWSSPGYESSRIVGNQYVISFYRNNISTKNPPLQAFPSQNIKPTYGDH